MSEFATLEEAFGVSSFLAPNPPALRGGVGEIADERYRSTNFSKNPAVTETAEPAPRQPFETKRAAAGAGCPPTFEALPGTLAALHAQKGARGIWNVLPAAARLELLWISLQSWVESDAFFMLLLAGLVYLLFR